MSLPNWPRCPKCKSQEVRVTERWAGMTITWDPSAWAEDGEKEMGDPASVHGECLACGHGWRFRGLEQIKSKWWQP